MGGLFSISLANSGYSHVFQHLRAAYASLQVLRKRPPCSGPPGKEGRHRGDPHQTRRGQGDRPQGVRVALHGRAGYICALLASIVGSGSPLVPPVYLLRFCPWASYVCFSVDLVELRCAALFGVPEAVKGYGNGFPALGRLVVRQPPKASATTVRSLLRIG
jgi:hypothetical protein